MAGSISEVEEEGGLQGVKEAAAGGGSPPLQQAPARKQPLCFQACPAQLGLQTVSGKEAWKRQSHPRAGSQYQLLLVDLRDPGPSLVTPACPQIPPILRRQK